MNTNIKEHYEARARIMKALSHPTRLFIVDQIFKLRCCVGDLTEIVGDDISTVSRHLSVLKNAGIVTDEKRGQQVFYSLCIPCVLDFLSCAEKVLKANAKKLTAAVV